ncbi:hypothetical protein [Haloferax sulfurifontis]|uniref:Uncharacterized protein n=1 Tax=Haloferax sulfurifontis TaxID=255616 RepID=A0A830DQ63_9EURY|nr:hypothetical protein [Haloferax sulfurifontis]GGC49940.1 hypothetical protein GCM10007209_09510 [Haloferax sulfurifontis]
MNRRDIRGQVDPKSAEILLAIQELGEASTNEIRQRTGLNPSEVQYRRNKLNDLGLVDLVKRDTHLGEQYEWSLTGGARRELERGLGAAAKFIIHEEPDSHEVSAQEFREMQEELRRLRESQKAAAYDARGKDVVERDEFEDFRSYVYEWHEAAETYLRGIRSVIERYVPGVDSLADHFEDVDAE